MLKYPCMSSTLELKQGCIWRRYFCLRVQSVLNGAALRKYCHCLLILPSLDGRVSFGKSWESIRNSGRFWLPYFPRRKEVRVRASWSSLLESLDGVWFTSVTPWLSKGQHRNELTCIASLRTWPIRNDSKETHIPFPFLLLLGAFFIWDIVLGAKDVEKKRLWWIIYLWHSLNEALGEREHRKDCQAGWAAKPLYRRLSEYIQTCQLASLFFCFPLDKSQGSIPFEQVFSRFHIPSRSYPPS